MPCLNARKYTQCKPTPVFLPGESPWTEEPTGLQSMGLEELDMTERLSTAQQHAQCNSKRSKSFRKD